METIDPSQALRVWQRVRGESRDTEVALLERFIVHEWEDASIYLQLSRRCSGSEAAQLYQIFQQEQSHCACLKGIYTLITGSKPRLSAVKPPQEPLPAALRTCYGREMRCLSAYEARVSDPDYGHVFSRMLQQEKEHCRILLELIGQSR